MRDRTCSGSPARVLLSELVGVAGMKLAHRGYLPRVVEVTCGTRGPSPASGKTWLWRDDFHAQECRVFSVHLIYLLLNQHYEKKEMH